MKNIKKLEPGPALDELIWQKVFKRNKIYSIEETRNCPRYSRDISAAWEIVEVLRNRRITLSVSSIKPFDPKANYCEPFNHDEKYQVQVWSDDDQSYDEAVYGKTAEEAICRAALQVVGSSKA
jgi:hypothetical protein